MINKKLLLILTSIFIILTLSSCVSATEINQTDVVGNTIIVDGSATNQMYNPTVQTAINNASDGDTIILTGQNYEHCHFIVDRRLNIISNVQTTLSPCPSNIKGSDGVGVFYFSENASGSVLSGFTITNDLEKRGSVNPYGIYLNGANNITITDCYIDAVEYGSGISLNNTSDILITKTIVENSLKGIYMANSNNINLTKSIIQYNNEVGIYIGVNVSNTNIINNTIYRNNWKGIYYNSCINSSIISNNISANRDNKIQERAKEGTGIFVNSTIVNFRIKGNYIFENGNYGLFNSYIARPSVVNQTVEDIDQNFFSNHLVRAIFTQQTIDGGTGIIYTGSNVFSMEALCPSTFYEPGILKDGSRDMVFSQIEEISPGIYNVSFIRKDTGEIATTLNTVDVTFFLNKGNSKALIEKNDIAKIVRVVNGTATVNFTDSRFKSTGNTIIAISPGYGPIDFKITTDRLSAIYYVSDSNIPNGTVMIESKLVGVNLTKYVGSTTPFTVLLKDSDGNLLTNQSVIININGNNYTRITNNSGVARLNINLEPSEYTITSYYNGNDEYPSTSTTNTITILSTINGGDIVKMHKNSTQYYATFVDSRGNLIKNTNITFNINGVFYKRATNDKGVARLNINLSPNTYILTATNPQTKEEKSNIITVLSTITENYDLTKYYQNASQYVVKVLDLAGNPLRNTDITFNINGVLYKRTSNSSGYVKLNINLGVGEYIITVENNGCFASNIIKVLPLLDANDLTKAYGTPDSFKVKVLDKQGNIIPNVNVTFNINGVFYKRLSNDEGISSLNINLGSGNYIITSEYNGFKTSNIITVLDAITIAPNLSNNQIQSIIDSANEKSALKFEGLEYNDISLNINKEILLTASKTTLNGRSNNAVINVNANGVSIKNLNINANNASGIVLNNVKNILVENNVINSSLDKSKMDKYNSCEELLNGNAISVLNSQSTISRNTITYFRNGVYLENAHENTIKNNLITKNNFGIEFGENTKNTIITNNDIVNQIGLITFDMVEGPYGYGISIRKSGVNISITENRINENYMGIFLDSKDSTGIVIKSNEITKSTIEGFTANENYTPKKGAKLIVENNAIYNNALGPSLMILGEVSANPAGIYGPGEFDDDLKLELGPNWYGTTKYTTWGENNTGAGSLCPGVKTTLILCNLTSTGNGKYDVTFYNGNSIATKLPEFTYYFTLNAFSDKKEEVIATIINGEGTIEFSPENYYSNNNIIEGSNDSLENSLRPVKITYTYNVPNSEIPIR